MDKIKVGVTRDTQIPTRWIDQGANQAIILAETPYRQLAGAIEVYLKKYIADKTHWQKMLKNDFASDIDLLEEKNKIAALLPNDLHPYVVANNEVVTLEYPVEQYPTKITSLGFEKTAEIKGILSGIRGQYLLFEGGDVLNIRKHSGYEIDFLF